MTIAKVKRGQASWSFIYITLGFALSIEGSVISMYSPLHWPSNVFTYLALATVTSWLFIGNGWFQNKLIGWKNHYEEKLR